MEFKQKSLQEIMDFVESDKESCRFVARMFFVNNLETYYDLIEKLSNKADIIVRLSDEQFCKGPDTVPDLDELISFLDKNKDKNILIPHLAEYMRVGEKTERDANKIFSIINRHVFSCTRVWMPFFLSKTLFQSIVGNLDSERFEDALIEINDNTSDFSVTVFSKKFSSQKNIIDADGIREWIKLWDNKAIHSGMSFATRQIKQITETNGNYSISIISDPYSYIKSKLIDETKLPQELGSDEEWASLIPFISYKSSMEEIIPRALNMIAFNPITIISNWESVSELSKWLFGLWYKLGLNKKSDYISFSVNNIDKYNNLLQSLECSVFDCLTNTNLDEWIEQRKQILEKAGYHAPTKLFFEKLNTVDDARTKLKILTGKTHDERTAIIEIISTELKNDKKISDYKSLLTEKYPDLLLYLTKIEYVSDDVKNYFDNYKLNKIRDSFSMQLSKDAGSIDCMNFDSRGSVLYSMKKTLDSPYFLWFDGLGIEWIDLLLEKVRVIDSKLSNPEIKITTAVIPTITEINMEKADPETISEKKIDDLDSLSHIKDKSDCNYFSIVAKQIELMNSFAKKIVETINNHPGMDIIVTADHGMSRMAAKGFHETQAVNPPLHSRVFNLGRYCEIDSEEQLNSIANTKKDGNVIAFATHNHFTSSGNAPGEIHGGATPEEILVPVIRFKAKGRQAKHIKKIEYKLLSSDVYLNNDGSVSISIQTLEPADCLTIDFNGMLLNATTFDKMIWSVTIKGLMVDNDYSIVVCPDNLYSDTKEIIHVKRKGLTIDDDF